MVLSWAFGIILVLIVGIETFSFLWLQIKLALILILTIYHEYLGKCMRSLKAGENKRSAKFYRIINEIPTVLLIGIILIIVFKPL